MEIFGISDSSGEYNEDWGWFSDKELAETVLKIVQMSMDDGAELITVSDSDQGAAQLKAGLKPWMISANVDLQGKPYNVHVDLCWPPCASEGLVEDREDYRTWFVWARSTGEAIGRMAATTNKQSIPPVLALEAV